MTKPPPGAHLGWSDVAKSTFDQARYSGFSSLSSRKKSDYSPAVTHIVTPARPLNESAAALQEEPDTPPGGLTRRGSIFGGVMESWREGKAQKRRQELKKMIKVVTPELEDAGGAAAANANNGQSGGRPGMLERRLSAFNWM